MRVSVVQGFVSGVFPLDGLCREELIFFVLGLEDVAAFNIREVLM